MAEQVTPGGAGTHNPQTPPPAAAPTGNMWAYILGDLGVPNTVDNQAVLALWAQQEGDGLSYFNPFNIDSSEGQPSTSYRSQGPGATTIYRFDNLGDGVKATVAYLKQANFADFREALKKGSDPAELARALNYSIGQDGAWGAQVAKTGYPATVMAWGLHDGPGPESQFALGDPTAAGGHGVAAGAPPATSATGALGAPPTYGPPTGHGWDLSMLQYLSPGLQKTAWEALDKYDSKGAAYDRTVVTDLKNQYPQYAWLFDTPEFKTILTVGSILNLSPDIVQGMIVHTAWWNNTSVWMRYAEEITHGDRATALAMISSATATVDRIAAQLGEKLTGKEVSDIALNYFRNNAGSGGTISDSTDAIDTVTRQILAVLNVRKQGVATGGDVSTLADNFQKLAGQYMYKLTPAQLDNWVQRSLQGKLGGGVGPNKAMTGGDFGQASLTTGAEAAMEQFLKSQAAIQYPFMKEQIAEGVTPAQYIAPYSNAAAETLQMAPTTAQTEFLPGGKFAFALGQKDGKTGALQPMSLANFTDQLRSNPKFGYQYTDNAQQNAWTEGAQLLRAFGAISGSVA